MKLGINKIRLFLVAVLWAVLFWPAQAHEVRPAFLKINEDAPTVFSVVWKQPVLDGRRLKINPVFPPACSPETDLNSTVNPEPVTIFQTGNTRRTRQARTVVFTADIMCDLRQGRIVLEGLERTLTDIFVQINYLNGDIRQEVLKPSQTVMDLGTGSQNPALSYLRIGVDHIIFGWDHLLFVIGLVLLVARRQIIGVATAFTVAHSLTLGLAALGLLSIPIRPVEILIAASIVLLGVEVMRKYQGYESLATRRPYLIGFMIGLIHGCGFASALSDIGLPKGTELLALLLFNIGVELGQFAVIALLVILLMGLAKIGDRTQRRVEIFATYAISGVAMYWVIDRVKDYWI